MAVRVAVGLGSNLRGPQRQLLAAAAALERVPGVRPRALSSAYRTSPIGPAQPHFLNAALLIDTTLSPLELLAALHGVEAGQGRMRGIRWGPRAIDLDILVGVGWALRGRRLTVPHPRLQERAFALAPLVEVWPGARDPVTGERYAEILERVGTQGVGPPRPLPARVPAKVLPHTADLSLEVSAQTLGGVFNRAAMALVDTMVCRNLVRERARRVVEARGGDDVELLVGLLSELVFLVDGKGFLPRRTSLLRLEPGRVRLAAYGEPLRGPEQAAAEVKAVTYHGARVERRRSGGFRARFVLDV